MLLFALLSPLLALGLLDAWYRPEKVYGRMSAWLGGLLWTFFFTICYWLLRVRDQMGFDFGSLTASLFTTEYALFWVPAVLAFLLFGRRQEINDSTYAFLYWMGGMMSFLGIRDFFTLAPNSQAPEIFLVPVCRLILLTLSVMLYFEWEDSRDLNWKILWALCLPLLWLAFSLVLAWAFLGWTPPAAAIIGLVFVIVAKFMMGKNLTKRS